MPLVKFRKDPLKTVAVNKKERTGRETDRQTHIYTKGINMLVTQPYLKFCNYNITPNILGPITMTVIILLIKSDYHY